MSPLWFCCVSSPLAESLRLGRGPGVGLRGDLVAEEAAEGRARHGEAVPGEHPLRRLHHQSGRPSRCIHAGCAEGAPGFGFRLRVGQGRPRRHQLSCHTRRIRSQGHSCRSINV
ncbi:protease Do-like 1, chloroplastic [Iris pallida]|uniref:Protease Do-like 1, chloroplastic n=1 Tax=Iris pallida TaxID=29817 RepID=A0AAX6E4T9_IRIPA|nr:protease Do-like 1, chloroplastic [Iris pallida]